jgi:hypothetical protein
MDEHYCSEDGKIAARMASVIAVVTEKRGRCLPRDLVEAGFSAADTCRCWGLAEALATIKPASRQADA